MLMAVSATTLKVVDAFGRKRAPRGVFVFLKAR